MLLPKYYYADDDPELCKYLISQPHTIRHFDKGEYLWQSGEYIETVYYILSGVIVSAIEHEDGYQKIVLFSGRGSIYPGCHETQFKIEQAITVRAVSEAEALAFPREQFYRMFQENRHLNAVMFETYAAFINLLLFEAAHQEFNSTLVKLCNLLYLFTVNAPNSAKGRVEFTQETLANILAVNRVNAAKALAQLRREKVIRTHRNWIEILDIDALKKHCSMETLL